MFILGGIGALVVWYMRKGLPESPHGLEATGETAKAEALLETIEREASRGVPCRRLLRPAPPSLARTFAPSSRPRSCRVFSWAACASS